jgi:hypothetical protein
MYHPFISLFIQVWYKEPVLLLLLMVPAGTIPPVVPASSKYQYLVPGTAQCGLHHRCIFWLMYTCHKYHMGLLKLCQKKRLHLCFPSQIMPSTGTKCACSFCKECMSFQVSLLFLLQQHYISPSYYHHHYY